MTRVLDNRSGSITYEFGELPLVPNHMVLVDGLAEIDWKWHRPDPDVGIFEGEYVWEVKAVCLDHQRGDTRLNLGAPYDALYAMIEDALHRDRSDEIEEQIDTERGYIEDMDD